MSKYKPFVYKKEDLFATITFHPEKEIRFLVTMGEQTKEYKMFINAEKFIKRIGYVKVEDEEIREAMIKQTLKENKEALERLND